MNDTVVEADVCQYQSRQHIDILQKTHTVPFHEIDICKLPSVEPEISKLYQLWYHLFSPTHTISFPICLNFFSRNLRKMLWMVCLVLFRISSPPGNFRWRNITTMLSPKSLSELDNFWRFCREPFLRLTTGKWERIVKFMSFDAGHKFLPRG